MTVPTQADGNRRSILERADERVAIETAIDAARAGAGGVLFIAGEAGVGKSELVAHARRRGRELGMDVLAAVGGELERVFPYGIVRQLFERRIATASDVDRGRWLEGAAGLARSVVDPATDPAFAPDEAVMHGLYWLVANLATDRPLLIAIDDYQWADAASAGWIGYLVRRLEGMPILVVLGVRSDDHTQLDTLARLQAHPLVRSLHPAPLSEAATGVLIAEALGILPSIELARACHEVTGGNPFLLQELATMWREQGVSPTAADVTRVGARTPPAIRRDMTLRLARAGVEATRLAQAVAILGIRVELRHAAAITSSSPGEVALAAQVLADAGILKHGRPLEFVHPILRSAVGRRYPGGQDVPAGTRARRTSWPTTHGTSTRWRPTCSRPRRPGMPGRWSSFGRPRRPRVARGAIASAIAYLGRALVEPPPEDVRPAVLLELGTAEALFGGPRGTGPPVRGPPGGDRRAEPGDGVPGA